MTQAVERDARVGPGGSEGEEERRARELIELLQELRIVLPGVQVLFAFLLTVPFAARFVELTALQRNVFFATLLCTAAATALLIAPSDHHRLLWRRGAREARLRVANALTVPGLLFIVPAMVGVVFVISDLMFDTAMSWQPASRCCGPRFRYGISGTETARTGGSPPSPAGRR